MTWLRQATRDRVLLVAAVLLLGTALRFLVSQRGSNLDLDSFRIVADLVTHGENVYAGTTRYNYGPVWSWLLGGYHSFADLIGVGRAFRGAIIATLTLADAVCAAVLWRRFSGLVAAAFFLNPVSIVISGYHNQFDTLAIAVGLISIVWLEARWTEPARRLIMPLALLGVSLSIKHVFIALPLWLAFRAGDLRRRSVLLLVPLAVMAASFTPYLGALGRIRENVVEYRYFANGLYPAIAPDALEGVLSPTLVLLLALVGFGWLERHRAPFDQALRYLMVLVCFSPSVANQYLAIPMAAAIALLNPFFALYVAVASLILLAHPEGLHWATLSGDLFPGGAADKDLHLVALACLGAGLAWLASGRDGRELGDLLRRALPRIGG